MLIIPAIDIMDGKCVRLRQGDYEQKTIYAASPAEVAKQFAETGFTFLHVVDLQGAKEKKGCKLGFHRIYHCSAWIASGSWRRYSDNGGYKETD